MAPTTSITSVATDVRGWATRERKVGAVRSTDRSDEKPQEPETPAATEGLFDWSSYEAWHAERSEGAFLWMLVEDE